MNYSNNTKGIEIQTPDINFTLNKNSKNPIATLSKFFGLSPHEFANGDTFKGKLVNGRPNGKGIYAFNNGDKIEGEFVSGVIQKEVTYYFANGAKYIGEHSESTPNGKGKYMFKNQTCIIGQFQDGIPAGQVKITQSYQRGGYYLCTFDYEGNFEGIFVDKNGHTNNKKFSGHFANGALTIEGPMKKGIS